MEVRHAATHLEVAHDLYKQRLGMHKMPHTGADSQARLETRLRLALDQVARKGCEATEPSKPEDAFIAVAATLLRHESEAATKAWAVASEQPELVPAIVNALMLFPPCDATDLFTRLYREQPTLRVPLFDLYRHIGAQLAPVQVTAAELQKTDPELQAAALRYAAEQPRSFPLEQFRAYYRDAARQQPQDVLVAALWGGLLRGDSEAVAALTAAATKAEDKVSLIRLMALSGEPEHFPALQQMAADDPVTGLPLLGLYGCREVVPVLLEALERPESAEAAAEGWQWLFGQTLPLKPKMEVVSEGASEPVATAGEIPDAQAAQAQWQNLQPAWQAGRLFWGRPLDAKGAAQAAVALGGRAGRDALMLLTLISRGEYCIAPEGWICLRQQRLHSLTSGSGREQVPTQGVTSA